MDILEKSGGIGNGESEGWTGVRVVYGAVLERLCGVEPPRVRISPCPPFNSANTRVLGDTLSNLECEITQSGKFLRYSNQINYTLLGITHIVSKPACYNLTMKRLFFFACLFIALLAACASSNYPQKGDVYTVQYTGEKVIPISKTMEDAHACDDFADSKGYIGDKCKSHQAFGVPSGTQVTVEHYNSDLNACSVKVLNAKGTAQEGFVPLCWMKKSVNP